MKIERLLSAISSKRGQKAYATRIPDFVVFCDVHQRGWRDALAAHGFLERIHERRVFSRGSLWSIHSVVSSTRLALFDVESLVDKAKASCVSLSLSLLLFASRS